MNSTASPYSRPEMPQGATVIRETACVKHLDPRGVVAIEGCRVTWTSNIRCIGWGVEPQPNVIGVDRSWDSWIHASGGSIFRVHGLRHNSLTRRDYECLDAEAADKIPNAVSVSIGHDVALVPRQTKRFIWDLDDKEIVVGLLPQPRHLHVEVFNGPQVTDRYPSRCIGKTGRRPRQTLHKENLAVASRRCNGTC